MISILYLLGGLFLLLLSGDFLVKGGVSIAKKLNVSTMVIGLTVVSFGTSAPELLVSLQAALNGYYDISLGNVVGSNITNIALVLAITAVIAPITVQKSTFKFDYPFMMGISVLFFIFLVNDYRLVFWEGLFMFVLLLVFVWISFKKSKPSSEEDEEVSKQGNYPLWLALLFIVGSCVGLLYGAKWLVRGASELALTMGVSERAISVTIVAFGTSVPELVTSIIATVKKQMDISVGNIIGSNIFNILGIMGVTTLVKNMEVSYKIVNIDMIWMLAISLLLGIFMFTFSRKVTRGEGFILMGLYVVYIVMVFV